MQSSLAKLRWGMRTVGVAATMRGAARIARLYLFRSRRAEVRLKSGLTLEFAYPSQFPPVLLLFGDLIDPEFAFLRHVARPEWTVVDAGAAIGQFSLFAAELPVAAVHAFEPSGANVATLQVNIARNRLRGVTVHKVALSSAESEATFKTTPRTWMSGIVDGRGDGVGEQSETVPVRTLDAELRRLGLDHVSVLKVNVAGYEPKVIEGAYSVLERGGVDILILLLGIPSLPCYERISRYGYRFFYFHPRERTLYEVKRFDEASVLNHRPWPARHIIAIRDQAVSECVRSGLRIRSLPAEAGVELSA